MKADDVTDPIEVTISSSGGALLVALTAGFTSDPAVGKVCGIRVMQNNQEIDFVMLEGSRKDVVEDYSCSGNWLFTGLDPGIYTFRAEGFIEFFVDQLRWYRERQIAVFEFP